MASRPNGFAPSSVGMPSNSWAKTSGGSSLRAASTSSAGMYGFSSVEARKLAQSGSSPSPRLKRTTNPCLRPLGVPSINARPLRSTSVGRMADCQTSSKSRVIPASSITTNAYLRPRAGSGVSNVHTSIIPPVTSSSRLSCSFMRAVIGAKRSTSSRHASSASLYDGANHPTGCPAIATSLASRMPHADFPHRRPHMTTRNRAGCVAIATCPGCRLWRRTSTSPADEAPCLCFPRTDAIVSLVN